MKLKKIRLLQIIPLVMLASNLIGAERSVRNVDEFKSAVEAVKPGDTIVLANGVWRDADLVFVGEGTEAKPITLRAEEPGKVTLEGRSRLRIAGEYLVVSGLVFINGSTPGSAVIAFRKDRQNLANYSRVTNCVIDNYNQSERFKRDSWVLMYGKHNRFDHNYLANKKNDGVTMAVVLNDERNQQNFHRIDHNFFGYKPRLGSNGGETLRVGTSKFSLTSSNTIIEENFFYRCNGETEVASIKAGDNIIRNNTFYECEGSLVMRHGNNNVISGNFFIGNNKPETGGLRVINAGHKIFNNHFQDLKGDRFRSALAVMNGVPNSLVNRYHKVKDAVIAHNSFYNCENIKFGVGSDFERTDVPDNVLVANNLFVNAEKDAPFEELDDMSGVTFEGNVAQTQNGDFKREGFVELDLAIQRNTDGLLEPTSKKLKQSKLRKFDFIPKDVSGRVGSEMRAKPLATAENTGVPWYKPDDDQAAFGSGKVVSVGADVGALVKAVDNSEPGEGIEMTESGDYLLDKTLEIRHPLTIRAKKGLSEKPLFLYPGSSGGFAFISIENGGSLQVSGLAFDGGSGGSQTASAAIRSSEQPMIEHYSLFVDNCSFTNFQESRSNAFKGFESTYADSVVFTNCSFSKMSGDAISLASQKEDRGRYNAEFVVVENCVFRDVMGIALNLYRGGNDESTFGPILSVDHCVFENVNNREQGSVLRLIGVQIADIRNSTFSNSGRGGRSVKFEEFRWDKIQVSHCNLYNSGRVESFYDKAATEGMLSEPPMFRDKAAGDFRLQETSKLRGRASDGLDIGLKTERTEEQPEG